MTKRNNTCFNKDSAHSRVTKGRTVHAKCSAIYYIQSSTDECKYTTLGPWHYNDLPVSPQTLSGPQPSASVCLMFAGWLVSHYNTMRPSVVFTECLNKIPLSHTTNYLPWIYFGQGLSSFVHILRSYTATL